MDFHRPRYPISLITNKMFLAVIILLQGVVALALPGRINRSSVPGFVVIEILELDVSVSAGFGKTAVCSVGFRRGSSQVADGCNGRNGAHDGADSGFDD